jgi:hypothetical protein
MTLGPHARYAVSTEVRATIRIPSAVERLGIAGPGLFLRSHVSSWYPVRRMRESFTWACIPVINSHRRAINRDRSYARRLTDGGVTVTGFDWLPAPNNWETNLEAAIAFIAEVGGRGFVLDAEAEFRHADTEAQRYVDRARTLCHARGLWLGFSSFGMPPRWLPLEPFCRGSDMVIPQTYDRYHDLRSDYVMSSARRYYDAGATKFAFGSGAYRGTQVARRSAEGAREDRERSTWRWRNADEMREHLDSYPWFVESVIAWPIAGQPPAHIWEAYRSWWSRRRLGGGAGGP